MTDHPTTPIRETVERPVFTILDEHGGHHPDCGADSNDPNGICDCGFAEALVEANRLDASLAHLTALQAQVQDERIRAEQAEALLAALKLERDGFWERHARANEAALLNVSAEVGQLRAELTALQAENARLREDAARFRNLPPSGWVCLTDVDPTDCVEIITGAEKPEDIPLHHWRPFFVYNDAARTPTDGAG